MPIIRGAEAPRSLRKAKIMHFSAACNAAHILSSLCGTAEAVPLTKTSFSAACEAASPTPLFGTAKAVPLTIRAKPRSRCELKSRLVLEHDCDRLA